MYYILLIIILTGIDQFTKYEMMNISQRTIGYTIPVISNFFHLTYVENRGAIFGIQQGKIHIFTAISVVLIIYIIVTEFKNFKNYSRWTKTGAAIIAAGAAGNMIDRIFRGFVVDMIDFNGIWHFVFNVADVYIHIGIYIIIIDYFIRKHKEKKKIYKMETENR